MIDTSTKKWQSKKLEKTLDRSICCDREAVTSPLSHKESAKAELVHHDRQKRCSDHDSPIWLTRLRHTVITDVTHSKQEEEN